MDELQRLFENFDEYVYISDTSTFEIVYMNRKAREANGINSIGELTGKKCYEIVHHCSTRCSMCNLEDPKTGEFRRWRYYDPVLESQLLVRNTLYYFEGRRYRIELAIEISSGMYAAELVSSYQNLETISNEALRVSLRADTPDESLDLILKYVGEAIGGDRTYIFEQNEVGNDDNTYEWAREGVTSEIQSLQDLPAEVCANWYRNFRENRHIAIQDIEDIRQTDPLQYKNLKRQGIHSIVVVPLYDAHRLIGFYGVDNPPIETLEYASNMLQIMGHFIVATLRRRNLIRKLERMSHTDQMTGVGNRYAMNECIEGMQPDDSVGVVYCDLNELKSTNDSLGHKAGDNLILSAVRCLKDAFDADEVFRSGGDEFLVICTRMGEQEFNGKVKALREYVRKRGVVMAIGAIWSADCPNCPDGADELIRTAEQLMYQEKSEYYRKSGKDRRSRR